MTPTAIHHLKWLKTRRYSTASCCSHSRINSNNFCKGIWTVAHRYRLIHRYKECFHPQWMISMTVLLMKIHNMNRSASSLILTQWVLITVICLVNSISFSCNYNKCTLMQTQPKWSCSSWWSSNNSRKPKPNLTTTTYLSLQSLKVKRAWWRSIAASGQLKPSTSIQCWHLRIRSVNAVARARIRRENSAYISLAATSTREHSIKIHSFRRVTLIIKNYRFSTSMTSLKTCHPDHKANMLQSLQPWTLPRKFLCIHRTFY